MTGDELELLADYAAGLLDGTADGDAVAARIAADPEWAGTYEALRVADAEVHDRLAALPPAPIPPDVSARLDAALDAARPARATPPDATPATSAPPVDTPHAGTVVPFRRRRARVLAGLAAGVVVLAGTAWGVQVIRSTSELGTTSGSAERADSSADSSDSAGAPTAADGPPRRFASGTDYTAATLAGRARSLLAASSPVETPGDQGLSREEAEPKPLVSGPLSRLADPAGLAACLAALGSPSRPLATDFARFEGEPALILLFDPAAADAAPTPTAAPSPLTPSSRVTVVVVGPSCGAGGPTAGPADADERYRTTLTR